MMSTFLEFLLARPAFAPLVLREVVDGHGPGRELLQVQLVPILELVEAWLSSAGAGQLPASINLRSVVLHLGTNALVHSAAGALQQPLWGDSAGTMELARSLLLGRRAAVQP